jgi:hypothetical protein
MQFALKNRFYLQEPCTESNPLGIKENLFDSPVTYENISVFYNVQEMKKYPYDTHDICNLAVQRYLGFSAIFFRFRTKLNSHIIPPVNIREILVTGLIPCGGACRLS